MRTMLAVMVALPNVTFDHWDVTGAFLYGTVDEDLYMRPPPNLQIPDGSVLKLKKSLYGLKQAPNIWNQLMNDALVQEGYTPLHADRCVYVKTTGDSLQKAVLSLYVDDLVLASSIPGERERLFAALQHQFKLTDQNGLHWCLGIAINHDAVNGTISIDQSQYVTQMLERYSMSDCKAIGSPADPSAPLCPFD